jgi:hypothetical protein
MYNVNLRIFHYLERIRKRDDSYRLEVKKRLYMELLMEIMKSENELTVSRKQMGDR